MSAQKEGRAGGPAFDDEPVASALLAVLGMRRIALFALLALRVLGLFLLSGMLSALAAGFRGALRIVGEIARAALALLFFLKTPLFVGFRIVVGHVFLLKDQPFRVNATMQMKFRRNARLEPKFRAT
jgi:hypothetical protein